MWNQKTKTTHPLSSVLLVASFELPASSPPLLPSALEAFGRGDLWTLNYIMLGLLLSCFGRVRLCDPMGAARQAPLSMGFSRQEYWSALPCPPHGELPNPGIKPRASCIAGRFSTIELPGKPHLYHEACVKIYILFGIAFK